MLEFCCHKRFKGVALYGFNHRMVRIIGLQDDLTRVLASPCSPGHLQKGLEGPLTGTKVREIEQPIGS
jgi:hypothetical protein